MLHERPEARMSDRYEMIGQGYAATRREDRRIAHRIYEALGDASSVVNVGAGTGSYEPADRYVIAIEPSDVMAAQRRPHRVPAIRAAADDLPLRDPMTPPCRLCSPVAAGPRGARRQVQPPQAGNRGSVLERP
ncbi:MAG: hypothetical protein H0T69_04540 [Thermoleophilaceae bacterium]|nr:hypothetical protein [Thermoleophilaceae bacterium]